MGDSTSAGAGDQLAQAWQAHHAYLVNLAYHVLGDVGEAEDVAQEAFLRLSQTGPGEIDEVRGWLTVVAVRLCLDVMRSARARREYAADIDDFEARAARAQPPHTDPADRVTLDDEVSHALLEVLRRLTPAERVAFVLHDAFGVPFETIADTVGRPVATCRQLARRARGKITARTPRLIPVTEGHHHQVVEKFITACASGEIRALAAVLDPSVWGVGRVVAAPAVPPQINYGPDAVAANLLRFLGPGVTLVSGPGGGPVLLGFANRALFAIVALTLREDRVVKLEATFDPAVRFPMPPPPATATDSGWIGRS